jgi:hypothetical protein
LQVWLLIINGVLVFLKFLLPRKKHMLPACHPIADLLSELLPVFYSALQRAPVLNITLHTLAVNQVKYEFMGTKKPPSKKRINYSQRAHHG